MTSKAATTQEQDAAQDPREIYDRAVQETRETLSTERRRPATIKDLLRKKVREDLVVIPVELDGEQVELTMLFRAIDSESYDALMAKYPPTKDQQKQGMVYDVDKFAPALISAVAVEPHLTFEEAKELYEAKNWSQGELTDLFIRAQRLCNAGLDVSFTAAG